MEGLPPVPCAPLRRAQPLARELLRGSLGGPVGREAPAEALIPGDGREERRPLRLVELLGARVS
jgi:hypothetical protein